MLEFKPCKMKTTLVFLAFVGLSSSMFRSSIPGEFGEISQSNNANLNVIGSNNNGILTDNHNTNLECWNTKLELNSNENLKVKSKNSHLKLSENKNSEINVDNSELNAENCHNLNLSGKDNKVVVVSSRNCKLDGNNNEWKILSSKNLDVKGNNVVLESENNENFDFKGTHGAVVASENVNLKVSGNNNNLGISKTRNHDVQPSLEVSPKGRANSLEILPSFRSCGSFSFLRISGEKSAEFKVGYVDAATISGESYELGIFTFTAKPLTGSSHEVTISESALDSGSLSMETLKSSEVLLSGSNQGIVESLKLNSNLVSQTSQNVFILDWSENC